MEQKHIEALHEDSESIFAAITACDASAAGCVRTAMDFLVHHPAIRMVSFLPRSLYQLLDRRADPRSGVHSYIRRTGQLVLHPATIHVQRQNADVPRFDWDIPCDGDSCQHLT